MVAAFAASIAVSGCDDTTGLEEVTRADVTKSYTAVLLTTTTNGVTTNHLAAGGDLDLTLRPDGTTIGRVFIPEIVLGGDFEESLAGFFTFDDVSDEVTLEHVADTFLRDMTFLATFSESFSESSVQLTAEEMFGGTLVRVVLR